MTPTQGRADALELSIDGLRYLLDRAPDRDGGRVVVAVEPDPGSGEPGSGQPAEPKPPPLRDRGDLSALRARQAFAQQVADAFRRQRREVLAHLNVLLDQVERAAARSPAPQLAPLGPERRAAASKLLERGDLLDRAAAAATALGYVGEERTKRLAYLVATSRLSRRPLSAILQAPSGTGKSELLEVVTALLPPEAVEFISRLTPQALYYAGPDHLRHKFVGVDEQAGASESDYAIRTLQSKGLLRLALPLRGRTAHFEARGPIALMSGTTSSALNPENLSRCLQLALDSSPEQTQRIQAAQRAAWTGKARRTPTLETWQDAQRLLERLEVAIPFAERLSFPARTPHDRRGNQKLLGLVAAHALLHQRQRERDRAGRLLATTDDYRAVHALLVPVVADDLDGLSPRPARLLRALAEAGAGPVTRREAAALLDGSYNTAKRARGAARAGARPARRARPAPPLPAPRRERRRPRGRARRPRRPPRADAPMSTRPRAPCPGPGAGRPAVATGPRPSLPTRKPLGRPLAGVASGVANPQPRAAAALAPAPGALWQSAPTPPHTIHRTAPPPPRRPHAPS